MTENYKPKVGDTVKATLGDNVVYGRVHYRGAHSVTLAVGDTACTVYLDGLTWHFEPWTPPIEFKPLTVVRLDDDAFKALDPDDSLISESRYNNSPFAVRPMNNYWVQPGDTDWELGDDDIARILAVGKAEILFAGVEDGNSGVDQ
jgi:hypothetical protein